MPRRKQTEGEKKLTSARWLKTLACPRPRYPVPFRAMAVSAKRPAPAWSSTPKRKNYVPNMLARGLVTQQSYNISLVFSRQFGNLPHHFCAKPSAPCTILPPAMIMMC